jgi:hypothetical protein
VKIDITLSVNCVNINPGRGSQSTTSIGYSDQQSVNE